MKVLVTGATGYIGGRLVPLLLERGHSVRVLVRDASRIDHRPWRDDVEVVVGDMTDPASLPAALEGVDAAYYLVHSMYSGRDYPQKDRRAAEAFCENARHLDHVIYLGGLLPKAEKISQHLTSRAEVGEILRASLPATELRAGPIVGSGSASFEMVRYLSERLPLMITPKWVLNKVQPLAVRDILSYMVLALERRPLGVIEVGAEPLSFKEMLQRFAGVRGYRRLILNLPVLTPYIAGVWTQIITPIPNSLAVPLVMGMVHPVLADTARAREIFPEVEPMPYEKAVALALKKIERGDTETRWSTALGGGPTYELHDWEGKIREIRSIHIDAPPERVFREFSSLGGDRGWLSWNWAWKVRGIIDSIFGGPGLRRGRRHPTELLPGEEVDFWRVEAVESPKKLRLRAEMRLPGHAWLEWTAKPEDGGTRLVQRALFAPIGLSGTLYWYSLYPFHKLIFSGLIRAIGAACTNPTPKQQPLA